MNAASLGAQTLRERTREAVREQVRDAAIELFGSRGFDATTTEDIARAAGMSPRSFFRYFETKEDVLISGSTGFGDHVCAALAARPDDEPIWRALRRSLDPVAASDSPRTLEIVSIAMSTASLRAHGFEKHLRWEQMMLPIIVERLGDATAASVGRAEVLAHAAMACLDVAMSQWVRLEGAKALGQLLDDAFDATEAIGAGQPEPRPTSGP